MEKLDVVMQIFGVYPPSEHFNRFGCKLSSIGSWAAPEQTLQYLSGFELGLHALTKIFDLSSSDWEVASPVSVQYSLVKQRCFFSNSVSSPSKFLKGELPAITPVPPVGARQDGESFAFLS